MVDSCTPESLNVSTLAREESRRLGHRLVCTEQILLGTISEGTSIAAEVLKSKGVTLEQARIEVEKIIGRGSDTAVAGSPFPTLEACRDIFFSFFTPKASLPLFFFTPKASRGIALATEEAERLGHNCLNTDHLLLGTLRIEDGTALQVLAALEVDATEIRDLIVQRLGENTQR
jgi:ATP-dependent Clp protease ATP-binding subunit ClpC